MNTLDVLSPIDLRNQVDASEWAREANVKRPWRYDFFDCYVQLINERKAHSILELGSGPGFLAAHVLQQCSDVNYTLFDFSAAMHQIAEDRLKVFGQQTHYLVGDFKQPNWQQNLLRYDLIIIHQALHELRHKNYATEFHRTIKSLLTPTGCYIVCDHLCAIDGMQNDQLYMTAHEHQDALISAGFQSITLLMQKHALAAYVCH